MYTCGLCGELQPPRVRVEKVAIRSRMRTYPSVEYKCKRVQEFGKCEFRGCGAKELCQRRKKMSREGVGWEIVEEVKTCPKCVKKKKEEDVR